MIRYYFVCKRNVKAKRCVFLVFVTAFVQLLVCDLDTSLFLMPQHEFLWCRLSKHCCSFRYPCLVSLQYFKTHIEMHSLQEFSSPILMQGTVSFSASLLYLVSVIRFVWL